MVGKARSVATWIVLCFACLVPDSESWGANECPLEVDYSVEGPHLVARITASAPSRGGALDFKIKFRVPLDKPLKAFVDLQGANNYNSYAATHEVELTYIVKFLFRDIEPNIIYIQLNGRTVCFSSDEDIPNTHKGIVSYSKEYTQNSAPHQETPPYKPGASYSDHLTPIRPQGPRKPVLTPPSNPTAENSDAYVCGKPLIGKTQKVNSLIIGGYKVERGERPWSIPLLYLPGFVFKCGATIVSNRHVITAAHCVVPDGKQLKDDQLALKVGAFNLGRYIESGAKIMRLRSIVVHDQYDIETHANDLAMLTTIDQIVFSNYIIPACLWDGDPDLIHVIGKKGSVAGWGKTEKHQVSTILLRLTVPIVSLEECRASNMKFEAIAVHKTLCAGARDDTAPCNGDSGGGLFLFVDGRWKLRAIVSLSITDENYECDTKQFVLYTDLAQYSNWIQRQMA